jgi:trypsin
MLRACAGSSIVSFDPGEGEVRRRLTRARIAKYAIVWGAACIAVGVVATMLPGAYAADTTNTLMHNVPALPGGARPLQAVALPHSKLPPGARPATHGLPPLGRTGPAFQQTISPRLVNGTVANAADYRWIVGIESLSYGQQNGVSGWFTSYCTGTLFTMSRVITAAQCVADLPFGRTVVIAGRSVLDDNTHGGTVVGVSNEWIDQSFNLGALDNGTASLPDHDVAVLTLDPPLSDPYGDLLLQRSGDGSPPPGAIETVVGYGSTGTGLNDAGTLRTAGITVQPNAACASSYSGYDGTRMMCAGTLGASGPNICTGDAGAPVINAGGWEIGLANWTPSPCGSGLGVYALMSAYGDAAMAEIEMPHVTNLDWSGDAHSDLLARDKAGNLYEYSGSGFAGGGFPSFDGQGIINSGWGIYTKLFRVTNWNGDGGASIMAETSNGDLYRYDRAPDGSILPRVLVGNGWNAFSDIMVTNNWTGDGHPNLMGRTANGDLVLYTSDGHGGWLNPNGTLIGTGWNGFNTVLTPGTWLQGLQTLIGRTPHGELVAYAVDWRGDWVNPNGTLIGTGWNSFSIFMSPGDWNGDDRVDVIGITPGGVMYLYTTDGHGNWQTGIGQQIGAGWQMFNRVF